MGENKFPVGSQPPVLAHPPSPLQQPLAPSSAKPDLDRNMPPWAWLFCWSVGLCAKDDLDFLDERLIYTYLTKCMNCLELKRAFSCVASAVQDSWSSLGTAASTGPVMSEESGV